jgi:hypothetical protein
MGVHFKPGGAFPFLEAPAGELHNVRVPLDVVWGKSAAEMQERLLETRTAASRFRILEQCLPGSGRA